MKKRILVIDDEDAIRFALKRMLGRAGYEVSEAVDGHEVLSLMTGSDDNADAFDLMLMDVQMPGMTGIELLEKLSKAGVNTPAIAIAGVVDETTVSSMRKHGCRGIVAKPFNRDELLGEIDTVLAEV